MLECGVSVDNYTPVISSENLRNLMNNASNCNGVQPRIHLIIFNIITSDCSKATRIE